MTITTFPATLENGQVRFASDVHLPENTKVYVFVPEFEPSRKFDLAEMVAQMPADYQACEEDFGPPVGKEEW